MEKETPLLEAMPEKEKITPGWDKVRVIGQEILALDRKQQELMDKEGMDTFSFFVKNYEEIISRAEENEQFTLYFEKRNKKLREMLKEDVLTDVENLNKCSAYFEVAMHEQAYPDLEKEVKRNGGGDSCIVFEDGKSIVAVLIDVAGHGSYLASRAIGTKKEFLCTYLAIRQWEKNPQRENEELMQELEEQYFFFDPGGRDHYEKILEKAKAKLALGEKVDPGVIGLDAADQYLREANEDFEEMKFATVNVLRFTPKVPGKYEVEWLDAGGEKLIIVTEKGRNILELSKDEKGKTIIGLPFEEEERGERRTVTVSSGDFIISYCDAFREARKDKKSWGEAGVRSAVERVIREAEGRGEEITPDYLQKGLVGELRKFQEGKILDDESLIVVRMK